MQLVGSRHFGDSAGSNELETGTFSCWSYLGSESYSMREAWEF